MKIASKINPKNLFRSNKNTNKNRSVSRSDPSSFGSHSTTSSGSPPSPESSHRYHHNNHRHSSKSSGGDTPTSVLRINSHSQSQSHEISSDEWPENSKNDDVQFELVQTTSSASPESTNRHRHKSNSSGGTTPTTVLRINSQSNEISSDKWLDNPTNDVVRFQLVQATSFGSPESTNRHRQNSKSSGGAPPTTVLRKSNEISSDDWPENCTNDDVQFELAQATSSASPPSPESTNRHRYDSKSNGGATPTTVLRINSHSHSQSHEISSDDWLHNSTNDVVQFELVQAFRFIDTDGDGKITRSDLETVLIRIGGRSEPLIQDELSLMLNEIDRNGDGIITLEEFGAISSAFSPAVCDTELRDVFEFFDGDHDGQITAEELFEVFSSIGEGRRCSLEECRCMISSVDVNGDGFVCFEDFSRMMELHR